MFKEFLSSHIPAWPLALNDMCVSNSLHLKEHGFLGRESRGRIFIVYSEGDEAERALKVVLTEAVEELNKEYEIIRAYSNTQNYGALPVVSLCANDANDQFFGVDNVYSVNSSRLMAAGYLMSTGRVPAHWETLEEKQAIFQSLGQFHKKQIIHGYPRRQNVISSDEKLLWIDFMTSNPVNSSVSIRQDVVHLYSQSLVQCKMSMSCTVYIRSVGRANVVI